MKHHLLALSFLIVPAVYAQPTSPTDRPILGALVPPPPAPAPQHTIILPDPTAPYPTAHRPARPTAEMKLAEIEIDVLFEHYKKLFGQLQDLDTDGINPDDAGEVKCVQKLTVRLQQLKFEIKDREEKIQQAIKDQAESRPVKTG